MADPLLDAINITTLPEINDDCIEDNFFLGAPLQAYIRQKCLVPFRGGAFMRNAFQYNPLYGGAYAKGIGGFNLNKPNTLGVTVFDPRYYCVMIVEYLEDIHVLNSGDLAVFSLLEADMANAYQTISAIMALDMQQQGQSGARVINMNGWVEAINDGYVPSYDGNVYTSYGTAPRNGVVRQALNGNVYWGGNPDGTAGAITYDQLNAMHKLGRRGKMQTDLMVGNKPICGFVENRIQPQQRFGQEAASVKDPYYGVDGFKFKSMMVLEDDYFPSAQGYPYSSTSNGGLGSNMTADITYTAPAAANTPASFATINGGVTTITPGEVLVMFNTMQIRFRVSDDKEFGFNPTDFIRAPDNTRVVSQLKAAVNLEFTAPWSNVQGYGWNS
jgi:hypothetical protein